MDKLRLITSSILTFLLLWFSADSVHAIGKVGMHVLQPEEIEKVSTLFQKVRFSANADEEETQPLYITITYGFDDINHPERWNEAFRVAKENNIIPLVRLSTSFDAKNNAWQIPNRYQLVKLLSSLDSLEWPQSKRHVILFNEPNHAPEWGGTFDVESLANSLQFAADWLHTEQEQYIVMPPALDLAAANTADTKEAFEYWSMLLAQNDELLNHFDAWNSHSYPNPGFISSPYSSSRNSLRGYEHELAFLSQHTDKQWSVYITETGWLDRLSESTLRNYYRYAMNDIWSDERVVAVTPFLLAGAPGPFSEFSFIDQNGNPTRQWQALSAAISDFQQELLSLKQ